MGGGGTAGYMETRNEKTGNSHWIWTVTLKSTLLVLYLTVRANVP